MERPPRGAAASRTSAPAAVAGERVLGVDAVGVAGRAPAPVRAVVVLDGVLHDFPAAPRGHVLVGGVPCGRDHGDEHQAVGRPHLTRGSGPPARLRPRAPLAGVGARRPSSSHVAAALAMSRSGSHVAPALAQRIHGLASRRPVCFFA